MTFVFLPAQHMRSDALGDAFVKVIVLANEQRLLARGAHIIHISVPGEYLYKHANTQKRKLTRIANANSQIAQHL